MNLFKLRNNFQNKITTIYWRRMRGMTELSKKRMCIESDLICPKEKIRNYKYLAKEFTCILLRLGALAELVGKNKYSKNTSNWADGPIRRMSNG